MPRDESRTKIYHSFATLNGVSESALVLALDAENDHDCEEALPLAKRAADVSARFNSDGSITPRWDASRLTTLEEKESITTESEFDIQLLMAERGDAKSCCQVGYAYMLGLYGVEQDGLAAQTYFERGMAKEEAACFSGMGQLYARGVVGGAHPIERNPQLAAKYYRRGAEVDHPPSLNGLGYLYAAGALSPTGERDFESAARQFDKSASLNSPPGVYNLGTLYLNGKGVPQDSLKAFEKFKRASAMGSLLATYQLGNMWSVGAGPVQRNCQHALAHFNQVHRLGPWNLRWNYAKSALYAGNPGEALLHYLILGALGRAKASQNAMFVIERFFNDPYHPLVSYNGTVGSQEWRKEAADGVDHYRSVLLHRLVLEAAKHGSADAKLDLAAHFWDGIGTPKNRLLAKEAYQSAANEGNVEAMYMLGWLHSTAFEDIYEKPSSSAAVTSNNNNNNEQQDNNNEQQVKNKEEQQKEVDEDDENAPRKRRLKSASSDIAIAALANKNNNNNRNQNSNQQQEPRPKRDIHLAKRNYDRVLELSPQSWFAVKLALIRLNFLRWYDHFITNPQQEINNAAASAVSAKATTTAQQKAATQQQQTAQQQQQQQPRQKMSLKQTYHVLRRLAMEFLKAVDPVVVGAYTLSDIFLVGTTGILICLLLIRHHAFGV